MAERQLSEILEETFVRCRDMDVPLADRLQAFASEVRRMGPHFATAVDSLVDRLMQSGAGATAPKVGEPMPPFLLPDEQGNLLTLDDLISEGPVAIAFHRGPRSSAISSSARANALTLMRQYGQGNAWKFVDGGTCATMELPGGKMGSPEPLTRDIPS